MIAPALGSECFALVLGIVALKITGRICVIGIKQDLTSPLVEEGGRLSPVF